MNRAENKISNAIHMMVMTAIVFIALVLVNVLVDKVTNRVDISVFDMYSLTDTTKETLDRLEKEVTIYIIADGPSNESITITNVVEQYAKYSDKIKVERVKPTIDYKFLAEHNVNVSMGSLVVECEGKSRGLEATSLIVNIDDVNGASRYMVDVEGQLTSAIEYVSSDNSKVAYVLSGNGKNSISSDLADYIGRQNITMDIVDLTKENKIPDDADILILVTGESDITESEYELVRAFLEAGGELFVATYYNNSTTEEFVYFNKFMAHYGLIIPGYKVIETNDANMYNEDTPYIVKPNYEEHKITEESKEQDKSVMLMAPDRIVRDDVPDTVTITSVLTSSDRAYAKMGSDKITQKLDTDPIGPFDIAVAVTDKISDDVEARLFVVTSSSLVEDTYDTEVSGGNYELALGAMQWLADHEHKVTISKKWMQLTNLVITVNAKKTVLYIAVIGIPLTIFAYGGYVWFRRKRR